MSKRAVRHCQGNIECILKTLSDNRVSIQNDSSVNISYSSNKGVNPFTYQAGTSITNVYEISISGSNKTSFTTCTPTTTLEVNCTGLFGGIFPGTQISTDSFGSEAVDGVTMNTGTNVTTGLPNPLAYFFYIPPGTNSLFPNGYSGGECSISITIEGVVSKTYNLVDQGLNQIGWTWDADNSTWYSTIFLNSPSEQIQLGAGLYYNIQVQIYFYLRNSTSSKKNQTWLQMDAELIYSKSTACDSNNKATVAGKMTSITLVS